MSQVQLTMSCELPPEAAHDLGVTMYVEGFMESSSEGVMSACSFLELNWKWTWSVQKAAASVAFPFGFMMF